MKKTLLPILVLLISTLTTQAQAQETGEDNLGAWYMLFTNNRVSEKLSIHAEVQYRNYEFADNFNQLLLRTALNYHISDNAMASFGLEQRFIDNPLSGNDTQHRARYFLRVTYPLNDKWFLTAYDEVFINLQNEFFGQNRLYGAVGHKFSDKLSTQVGYLKNDFRVDTFDRFQVAVFIKTDFRKKKKEDS